MGETTRIAKWDNVKFVLIYLVVLGHFMNRLKSDVPFIRGTHFFIYTFHMPAFLFLSGLFSKRTIRERHCSKAIPYLFLYFFMNIFQFVLNLLATGKAERFSIFDEKGVPWFALTLFFAYLITMALSDFKGVWLMIASISLGAMAGYDMDLGAFLSGMRLFTMYPFFLAGYCTDAGRLSAFTEKKSVKVLSGLILLGTFVCSLLLQGRLYNKIYFLKGTLNYKEQGLLPYGGIYRVIYYPVAFLLVFCVIAVIPAAEKVITGWGSRTIQVFAVHYPVLKLLLGKLRLKRYIRSLSPQYGDYLIFLFALILTVLLSTKWLQPFFDWLMHPIKRVDKTEEMA